MLIRTLLSVLLSSGYKYSYYGSEDADVFLLQAYSCGDIPEKGVLCWTDGPDVRPSDEQVCLLCGSKDVFEAARRALLDFYGRKTLLDDLRHAVSIDDSLALEAEICSRIMKNPVIFLRADLAPFFWMGFDSKEDLLWLQSLDRTQITNSLNRMRKLCLGPSKLIPHRFLISPYYYGETHKRFLVVVEKENPFSKSLDSDFLLEICSVLSSIRRPKSDRKTSASTTESIITGLFYGTPSHPEMIRQQLSDAGWENKQKYYVIAIAHSDRECTQKELRAIESILKTKLYIYEHYYIAITSSAWQTELTIDDYAALADYLKTKKMFAGLSYGFFDLLSLSDALTQAIFAATTIPRLHLDTTMYAFADDVITYLGDFCTNHNGLPRERLCHPTVLKILEYDREYHTDYLKFLGIYVFSGLSVKRTAEIMNYHRNTVYQRISRLERYFGLDFTDVYLYVKLYLSVTMLNNRDEVAPECFMLWKAAHDADKKR